MQLAKQSGSAGDRRPRPIHKDELNRGEKVGWRREARKREAHLDCHAMGGERRIDHPTLGWMQMTKTEGSTREEITPTIGGNCPAIVFEHWRV